MRKRFGQHFLVDDYTLDRIVSFVNPAPGDHILEVGPGGGVLTRPLVASGAQLVAIEIDRDLGARLQQEFAAASNFLLHVTDVLKVDLADLMQAAPQWKMVGNLPYNISTPLIMRLLSHAHLFSDMVVMLQREVAERLTAAVGTGAYGRLSVMAQRRAAIDYLLDVGPDCFAPPPKVDSAVIRIRPFAVPGVTAAEDGFAELVRVAFSQRRKTLGRTLRSLLSSADLAAAGIDPGARPETLSADDYARMATQLAARRAAD